MSVEHRILQYIPHLTVALSILITDMPMMNIKMWTECINSYVTNICVINHVFLDHKEVGSHLPSVNVESF